MMRGMLILMVLAGCTLAAWTGVCAGGSDQDPDVVLHFESGKASLSQKDKARLRDFFQTYVAGPQSRVFVVGYTDGRGEKTLNHKLSRQRANAVRREITAAFGIDEAIVMALGKGGQSAVGDNKSAKGRALNRRVEVYLANGQTREPPRTFGPGDPHLPDIQNLIQEAQALIKQRRFDGAMLKLNQAHALGGDHYSDWHAVWGIAGYYGGAPMAETRAHLVTALDLDPYNDTAREFLSRMQARQKVIHGEITRDMGRSVDTAIKVTTVAQQYEYLRLFEVEPLMHEKVAQHPVEGWYCKDREGARVVYYFNHSQIYHWAFAQSEEKPGTIRKSGSAE